MRFQTNLVRRGSRFYYRGRVPEDLKLHIGKDEILISLKTGDRQKADHVLAIVKAKLFANYARLRGSDIPSDYSISEALSIPRIAARPTQTTQDSTKLNSVTLTDLISYWASQSEKRPRTLMEAETARKRLVGVAGHDDANRIEKQHAILLKDSLLAQGLAVPTIQKQINLLRAAFEVGVTNDLVASNPFSGVKLVKTKATQKARIPFTASDLKLIFASPIFSEDYRPAGGAGEAAVWLPRIALLSGMRLEEIGQLLVTDISSENGIPYISVATEANSGKHLKTSSSYRRVPIHPELIKLGLLDYVQRIKVCGSKRLFPQIKSASNRQLTSSWSQWFSRYLRTDIGIKDPRKTFHSFRHGFKEACRLGGIAKDIHDQLTGHTSSDIGDGYGGDQYPLKPLSDGIANIHFMTSDFNSIKKSQKNH